MRLIALDPGGTTGWASWVGSPGGKAEQACGQIGPDDHHMKLLRLLQDFCPHYLICEDFKYRPLGQNESRMKIELTSVEYIGVVKLYMQAIGERNTCVLVIQPSSVCNGQRLVTDEMVKKMALWVPGMRHAMDAREHLLYYQIVTQGKTELIPRP